MEVKWSLGSLGMVVSVQWCKQKAEGSRSGEMNNEGKAGGRRTKITDSNVRDRRGQRLCAEIFQMEGSKSTKRLGENEERAARDRPPLFLQEAGINASVSHAVRGACVLDTPWLPVLSLQGHDLQSA
jgi:hypothetical protein